MYLPWNNELWGCGPLHKIPETILFFNINFKTSRLSNLLFCFYHVKYINSMCTVTQCIHSCFFLSSIVLFFFFVLVMEELFIKIFQIAPPEPPIYTVSQIIWWILVVIVFNTYSLLLRNTVAFGAAKYRNFLWNVFYNSL